MSPMKGWTLSRRRFLLSSTGALAAAGAGTLPARAEGISVKIGMLGDFNGAYSTLSGPGTLNAIKFAIDDFKKLHPEISTELVVADFQLKPDIGLGIMRKWFDVDGVDCVIDVPMSALAIGTTAVVKDHNKVALFTSAVSEDLTGRACGPNHVHWQVDTYALARTVGRTLVKEGGDTWYFITADYAMGHSIQNTISAVVTEAGGKVLGSTAHPFPSNGDFASYLLQAQASGAKVICLANGGEDLETCLKQAGDFGLTAILAAPFADIPQIHAAGLGAAKGLYFSGSYYWDRDDVSRAFSKRLEPFLSDAKAAQNHVGAYTAISHYLKAVVDVGAARAKDGRAVVERMKAIPIDDPYYGKGYVRKDGRAIHDMLLLRVKQPDQSRYPWDYATVAKVVSGDEVFRPLRDSACKVEM